MRNWIILGFVAVVGYGAFKWYSQKRQAVSASGNDTALPFVQGGVYDPSTYGPQLNPSGIPSFDTTPVSGDPQDLLAPLQTNALATHSGAQQYTPAFGAKTNQPGSLDISIW